MCTIIQFAKIKHKYAGHTLFLPSHPQQTSKEKSQFGDYRVKELVTEVLEYAKPK